MNAWELGLFKRGQIWIKSPTFRKKAEKIMHSFSPTLIPIIPEMVPVEFNKRIQNYTGLFCGDHIEIQYDNYRRFRKDAENTLRHEIVHLFIRKNYMQLDPVKVTNGHFEKVCMIVFGFGGDHGSFQWQYKCPCGWWKKTVDRIKKDEVVYCERCRTHLVTKTEYNKLVRISKINSKTFPITLSRYNIYEERKLIDI